MPKIRVKLPKPYPHQLAVLDAMGDPYRSGRIFVVKSKRQVGKTTLSIYALLKIALTHGGTLSVVVEPTFDQARRVYKQIIKSVPGDMVITRKNDTNLEIEFGNGSSILFKSAEQRDNLRGFTITGLLVVDECAFIQDDIFDILLPTTDVHRAPILLISTPKLKQGFFFRYYSAGMQGQADITSIDFNDFDTSFLLSSEKLEQYRTMMPKAQFTTEYLGEFLDTDSVLFSNISECVGPAGDGAELYVGIDWGSGAGGDYTSVCAFDERARMVFIDYFNDKSTFEQARYIADILALRSKQVRSILAESNSIGTPMIALLKDELDKRGQRAVSHLVTPFSTTNAEKVRLVNQLQVALEQKTVTLLDDRGLLSQLAAYEATYNPKTNNVSYNAPPGLHDDNCISTMLAYDAKARTQRVGQYTIGFNRPRQRHGDTLHH